MIQPIVLASNSPQRKRILQRAGIAFVVRPSGIEERIDPQWSPEQAAVELARQKAEAALPRVLDEGVEFSGVLAADTVVVVGAEILGKPRDDSEAFAMMKLLSQERHRVITGVCLWPRGRETPLLQADTTYVTLRPMDDRQIADYIASGIAVGKAGAFDVERIGGEFIDEIEGDLDNVIGLPMKVVSELIRTMEERYDEANRRPQK